MKIKTAMVCALLQVVVFLPVKSFAGSDFEAFYGHFVGSSVSEGSAQIQKRDIDVTIKPYKRGFNITWSTVTHRAGKQSKKSAFSINFRLSGRDNVFGSAMGKDKFGNEIPLDPLKGKPYVWAIIDGKTMTVNSLLVLEDGGYEIQTYERTLIDGGMSLEFSRIRNGEILKKVTSQLRRVE